MAHLSIIYSLKYIKIYPLFICKNFLFAVYWYIIIFFKLLSLLSSIIYKFLDPFIIYASIIS